MGWLTPKQDRPRVPGRNDGQLFDPLQCQQGLVSCDEEIRAASQRRADDGDVVRIGDLDTLDWRYITDTVQASDATFRILISPTPIVGPDRGSKNDNHANKGFTHEGDKLRAFIGKQKNMVVICGDRHWQYVSESAETGVREYSCGPASDAHAGGFSEKNRSSMHRYLKIEGGFLSVDIERKQGAAQAIFTHHGVDGAVYNRDVMKSENHP